MDGREISREMNACILEQALMVDLFFKRLARVLLPVSAGKSTSSEVRMSTPPSTPSSF